MTLSRFLSADKGQSETCFRIVALLLEAIGLHALATDAPDYEKFRKDLAQAATQMKPETPPQELLIVAGTVIRAIEDYNKGITQTVQQRNSEFNSIISMLTKAMITVCDSSERTALRLQDIEKKLATAGMIEDVRLLKLRMAECLEKIQEEREEQTRQSVQVMEDLQKTVGQSPKWESADAGVDLITGLPDHAAAEAALTAIAGSDEKAYAVLFVGDRVQLINTRFGFGAGDEVLKAIKSHLRKSLRPTDRLYRWRGPSFLAILKRSEQVDAVNGEITRLTAIRLEKTVEIGNKSVLLPIGVRSAVFPVSSSVRLLATKLDAFLAAHTPAGE